MQTTPFTVGHLDAIRQGELERHSDVELFRRVIADAEGPAFTLMDGEVPLGAVGIVRAGDDGWTWALFSDELRRKPFALHRTARKLLDEHRGDYENIYGTVREGFAVGQEWLRRLGFEYDRNVGESEIWVLKQQ